MIWTPESTTPALATRSTSSWCTVPAFISGVVTVNMTNVHERTIAAPVARVGALLDTLASATTNFGRMRTGRV